MKGNRNWQISFYCKCLDLDVSITSSLFQQFSCRMCGKRMKVHHPGLGWYPTVSTMFRRAPQITEAQIAAPILFVRNYFANCWQVFTAGYLEHTTLPMRATTTRLVNLQMLAADMRHNKPLHLSRHYLCHIGSGPRDIWECYCRGHQTSCLSWESSSSAYSHICERSMQITQMVRISKSSCQYLPIDS